MPLEVRGLPDTRYTLQVYLEDCTGCGLCVEACPAQAPTEPTRKAINLAPRQPQLDAGREAIAFFETLPVNDRSRVDFGTVRGTQYLLPLFEFSGACAGCGETPYLKLLSQLFGDRLMIANATGCSSIYGGNLPTTPWTTDAHGRGPAWSNSLFEDNAEFGLGFRLAADLHLRPGPSPADRAARRGGRGPGRRHPGRAAAARVGVRRATRPRRRTAAPARRRWTRADPIVADLRSVIDHLVRRSVWIVGGDGWAYDIGSGGLDHVLASGRNINVLVLDTEVYSNTGGQMSKATPLGAVAKFAAAGKTTPKKDLALQAIAYGNVYVARVAMGADPQQTLRALREAEAYDGPSLVIAYSHCIAHGIEMRTGMDQQYRAVASGYWPLIRYDPVAARRRRQPVPARLAPAPHPAVRLHPDASCATACWPTPIRPRRNGCTPWPSRPSTSAGRCTRRWPAAAPNGSRPTRAGRTDGPHHHLPGPDPAQPAGRVGLTAVADRRRRPAAGRRRRRRGRAALAVRGAATPRSRAGRAAGRRRHRQLRRVADLPATRSRRRRSARAAT